MQPSVYTQISKRIGHTHSPVHPPLKDVARALLKEVKAGKEDAFETVFRIYRNAITPRTESEREAMNIIIEAYQEGEKLFR